MIRTAYPASRLIPSPLVGDVSDLNGFLLNFNFNAPVVAPVLLYSENGDELVLSDSGLSYSVVNGLLTPGNLSLSSAEPRIRSQKSWSPVGGLAMTQRYRLDSALGATTGEQRIGFAPAIGLPGIAEIAGVRPNPGSLLFSAQEIAAINTPELFAFDTFYRVVIVLRPSGGYLAFVDDNLIWVANNPVFVSPVYSHSAAAVSNTTPPTYDNWKVVRLPYPFDQDSQLAILHKHLPESEVDYIGVANGIIDLRGIVLPAGSANLNALELRYNKIDANNYYWQRIVRNAGNTAWNLMMGRVVAGSSTTTLTVTGVGTPDVMKVFRNGSLHDAYTGAAGAVTKRGAQVTDANLAAASTVSVILNGATVDYLDVWARSPVDQPLYYMTRRTA